MIKMVWVKVSRRLTPISWHPWLIPAVQTRDVGPQSFPFKEFQENKWLISSKNRLFCTVANSARTVNFLMKPRTKNTRSPNYLSTCVLTAQRGLKFVLYTHVNIRSRNTKIAKITWKPIAFGSKSSVIHATIGLQEAIFLNRVTLVI